MENNQFIQLQNEIANLAKLLVKPKEDVADSTRSEQLNELFAALAKAQGEFNIAGLHSENPYFKNKYADLTSVIKATRPALAKHGLAVIQQIQTDKSGASTLYTILTHSSGQYISTQMRITPAKNDIQTLGSYLSYCARYSYARLLCVALGDDEDDDGEKAMIDSRHIAAKGPSTKYNPKEQSFETVSKDQLEELEYELADPIYADIIDNVLDGLKIQSLADMPKNKYMVSIERIRQIKALRSGIKPAQK